MYNNKAYLTYKKIKLHYMSVIIDQSELYVLLPSYDTNFIDAISYSHINYTNTIYIIISEQKLDILNLLTI